MKSLAVYPKNGLANRLRALASASILAEYTGRNLLVSWTRSRDCNVVWEELFLNPIEGCSMPLSTFRHGLDLYDDTLIPLSSHSDIPHLSIPEGPDVIAVHSCRNFRPEGMTVAVYEEAKSMFYRKLLPVETVRETVSDMQKRFFHGHKVIGVHIRRKDHLTFMKKDHRLVSPTRMFVEAMKQALRANPETKFFLATDDQKEERYIRRLFTDSVIAYEKKEYGRNTARGMQDALTDWLLLSRTSRIIASYASSFSQEAGVVHRIKTDEIVHEEGLSKNHHMPYLTSLLTTHYRILKEEGLKQYVLYSYRFRKNRICSRAGRRTGG